MARNYALVIGIIVFTAIGIGVPALLSDARFMIALGWVVTGCLFMTWICSIFGLIDHSTGLRALVAGVITCFIVLLGSFNVIQQAVPFCGDGVCSPLECSDGCADCSPEDCLDGKCSIGFEDCGSSADCVCLPDQACTPGRPGSSDIGCYDSSCGDGYCDTDFEDRFSCCKDCGCLDSHTCKNNICFFDTPRLTFTSYIAAEKLSVTTLAANPFLINSSGIAHPFMVLQLRNEVSEAYNVTVNISGTEELTTSWFFDVMRVGGTEDLLWYIEDAQELLSITETVVTNISIVITYLDGVGVQQRNTWLLYPFSLLGRNTQGAYSHLAFYVTPDDVKMLFEPESIWREYQDIVITEQTDKVQFPLETIEQGSGSPTDLALVYTSAFVRSGIKTSLVESDEGIFVRYWTGDQYRIIDPAKKGSFSRADADTPGYAVWDINQTWEFYNTTVLSIS